MFQHKAIECVDSTIKRLRVVRERSQIYGKRLKLSNGVIKKAEKKIIKDITNYKLVSKDLRAAPGFFIGDVTDWHKTSIAIGAFDADTSGGLRDETLPELKMPYPALWLSYSKEIVDGTEPSWTEECGLLAYSLTEGEDSLGVRLLDSVRSTADDCTRHCIDLTKQPHSLLVAGGTSYHNRDQWVWYNHYFLVTVDKGLLVVNPGSEGFAKVQQEFGHDVTVYLAFLRLLNCKNIKVENHTIGIKKNRQRRKKGKKPLMEYKTLNVTKPGLERAKAGSTPHQGGINRVHLCRGHFKTFTADKPLLGKHVGTYWWQPSLRGSKSEGLVVKDYNVKTR